MSREKKEQSKIDHRKYLATMLSSKTSKISTQTNVDKEEVSEALSRPIDVVDKQQRQLNRKASLVKKKKCQKQDKHQYGKKQERRMHLSRNVSLISKKKQMRMINALELGRKEREAPPKIAQGLDKKKRRRIVDDDSGDIIEEFHDNDEDFIARLNIIEEEVKNEKYSPP